MNEKFNDRLSHTTLGTDWDQTKRKYIAKIGDRYFYTQEQLRAFGQRAGKSAQGLGIRAKNDVAAVRNRLSRAVATRKTPGGNPVAVGGYNRAATKNAVKARASATRSNVVSAFDKIRNSKLTAKVSKSATGLGIRAKNDVAAAKNKAKRTASAVGKRAVDTWNSIRSKASKSRRFTTKSATGLGIRAKNDAAAVKNKAKRTANKVTSSVKNAVSSRWNEFKTGYQNGKKKKRPKGHERVVGGSAKVEKKGSGLNLGGPVGGKTPGSGINNKKKKK